MSESCSRSSEVERFCGLGSSICSRQNRGTSSSNALLNPGAPFAPAGPNCPVEPAGPTAHVSPGDPAVPLPPGILLSPGVSGARAGL